VIISSHDCDNCEWKKSCDDCEHAQAISDLIKSAHKTEELLEATQNALKYYMERVRFLETALRGGKDG